MKKIIIVFVAVFVSMGSLFANDSYKLDDSQVSAMFNSATETSASVMSADFAALTNMMATTSSINSGNTTTTVLIAWVVDCFLGGFGIHRYVLGTKGSMWAIYTFTVCGIFGIVPAIDWFVLLIDGLILKNGDKYIDNDKFFMWTGN